jgi:Mg-chelatase subunit ChlD
MSSTCRGCSCNFADVANLKVHLNAFPVCKTKKSPSTSSSNAVVPLNPSKGKGKGKSSPSSSNAVVVLNPKAPSNAVVVPKNVSSTNALMNGVLCNALSGLNLQPVGTPGTKTVFKMQVVQQVPVAVAKPKTVKINKQVMFVIDESGSMSGSKFNEAMNGCKTVLKSLSYDHDWVGIYLFDSRVRCISNPVFLKREGSNLEATINGLRCNGGGTAIYDAVRTASNAFVKPKNEGLAVQYELIVLTDGADGGSSVSNHSINAHLNALKASGGLSTLHVTVLAVGMSDRDRNEMRTMVNGLGEVHDVSSSAGAINDCFIKVVQKGIKTRMRLVTARLTYSD